MGRGNRQFAIIGWGGIFTAGMACLAVSGCGYHLQSFKHSAELEKEGIHKIYISPVTNNTYKIGVQNIVYNALIRGMVSYSAIQLVSNPADADAILNVNVNDASASVSGTTAASNLNTTPTAPPSLAALNIASEYHANLSCGFSLVRRNPKPGQAEIVWAADLSRSQPFPGSNQLGTLGTTSPLINDSEFDRTLLDDAQKMAIDVREGMLERF